MKKFAKTCPNSTFFAHLQMLRPSSLHRFAVLFFMFALWPGTASSEEKTPQNEFSAAPVKARPTTQRDQHATTVTLPPASVTRLPNSSGVTLEPPPAAAAPRTKPVAPIQGAVTTLAIENTGGVEQVNVPLTFGQTFAQGDLRKHETLGVILADGTAVPAQCDIKATYPDGSVRHAIISLVLPRLEADKTERIGLIKLSKPVRETSSRSKA